MVTGIDFENFAMFKFYWIYNSGNETILYLIKCCWSRLTARLKQKIDSKRIEGSEATTAKSSLLFVCGGLVENFDDVIHGFLVFTKKNPKNWWK